MATPHARAISKRLTHLVSQPQLIRQVKVSRLDRMQELLFVVAVIECG